MEVVTPPVRHRVSVAALGPISVGLGCCAAAAYTFGHNPSSGTGLFPPCPFHTATGLWCPGCGLTRATARLLHGDVLGALSFNALAPLVLGLIVVAWLTWLMPTIGRKPLHVFDRITPRWWSAIAFGMVIFGVVRNLPVAPFRALAP